MKNRKMVYSIMAVIILIGCICVNPIRTIYYDKQYTEELETLLHNEIDNYEYITDIAVRKMMTRERYILVEMSSEFNSLSREEKHQYLKDDCGENLQSVYTKWLSKDVYHNKLWECEDLTFLDIEIVIVCDEKTYKYGYYKQDKYYDFAEAFMDYDGTSYRFVNDNEKDEYYSKLSNDTKSIGSDGDNAEIDYNSLSFIKVTDDNTLGEVWAMSQSFVKEQLKSPKSADFPTYRDDNIHITNSGDYYKVSGYVDAENSFGAKLRNTFLLVLEKSGSKYILKECSIY